MMKKKHLEILLQQIPDLSNPIPALEQYMTPASIAAEIIYLAYQNRDIEGKKILDLGCGSGIFAVGAMLAGAKKAIGIDVDKQAITLAISYAQKQALDIDYYSMDIEECTVQADTVLMNPPFGAQKANLQADRRFLEKAMNLAPVIYSLHLKKTIKFLESMIMIHNRRITMQKEYKFPIKHRFEFHEKPKLIYDVCLLRIDKP